MAIQIADGFQLRVAKPLDDRQNVETIAQLDPTYGYEGQIVYVKDIKQFYTCYKDENGSLAYKVMETGNGGGGGASEAEFVSYDNESLPTVTNVEECLDAIIAKIYYVNPSITSFTCNPSRTAYEMGEKVTSVTFTWAYNKDMVSQTLTGCDLADETVREATYNTEFSSNKTFTLSASDGTNSTSANKSFTFQNKVHHGSASIPATYDSAFILSLNGALKGSKGGTYTVNVGTNQYFYIAMPTSFNNADVLVGTIGGFSTEFGKVATVSHTNASGYTCDYNIYKSTNHSLGSISFIV